VEQGMNAHELSQYAYIYKLFCFLLPSRPVLGPTMPPIKWVSFLSQG